MPSPAFPKIHESPFPTKGNKMNPPTQHPTTDAPISQAPRPLPRCSYHSPAGRHCRSEVRSPGAHLCARHTYAKTYRPDPAVANELLGPLTEFQSASDVTDFLSRLLILQAQDRISPRRAAVMAYTCNLLLRGLRAIDLEILADEKANGGPRVVFDLVRPTRDPVSDTTCAPIKPSSPPSISNMLL